MDMSRLVESKGPEDRQGNLNNMMPWVEDSDDYSNKDEGFPDNSTSSSQVTTTVYFRDIERNLIKHISGADAVFGCVAWLTNKSILSALTKPQDCCLIVQKEDFLRPDLESYGRWKKELRQTYKKIKGSCGFDFPGPLSDLSGGGCLGIKGVRCVGNYNRDKNPAFPRMHNKFLVFCRQLFCRQYSTSSRPRNTFHPYAVWTGSFNLTANSTKSLENAIYIEDETIANAYFNEFSQIASISEPLDWEVDWCAPQWQIVS